MPPHRRLRSHQAQVAGLVRAIAAGGVDGVRDILAAATPGGGKSLLPVIAATTLIAAGTVERVVWVVPRDSLRLQAEEAFADPGWQATLGHAFSVRAAHNEPDPSRGLAGYVTTCQGIAAAPELHLAEMRRHRTLLVVDEMHHLPSLADYEPGPAGDTTIPTRPRAGAVRCCRCSSAPRVRLLSGTLERADGRAVLWLPYRRGPRQVHMEASGWAVVGYSRAQAVAGRAVLPVTFGALDGEATWAEPLSGGAGEGERVKVGPHRLSGPHPTETMQAALFTALRTGFASELLRKAFEATRELRARRRVERALPAGAAARGLGKLLVVAPDQATARAYLDMLRGWMLKRATGGKNRSEMTLAELEAAVSWLERNRVSEHLHLLDGDMRNARSARQRSRMSAGMSAGMGDDGRIRADLHTSCNRCRRMLATRAVRASKECRSSAVCSGHNRA